MAIVRLAEDDAAFVEDCWKAVHYHDTDTSPRVGPGLPPFAHEPTPLEAVLVAALARARLAQYVLFEREVDTDADAIASTVFRGARGLADVSYTLWAAFEERVRAVHETQARAVKGARA